jgi:hypothetical protein
MKLLDKFIRKCRRRMVLQNISYVRELRAGAQRCRETAELMDQLATEKYKEIRRMRRAGW